MCIQQLDTLARGRGMSLTPTRCELSAMGWVLITMLKAHLTSKISKLQILDKLFSPTSSPGRVRSPSRTALPQPVPGALARAEISHEPSFMLTKLDRFKLTKKTLPEFLEFSNFD